MEANTHAISEVNGLVESEEGMAPFFVTKPSVQRLVEGRAVAFECQIGGSPQPHVYWKKAGVPLSNGFRYARCLTADSLTLYSKGCLAVPGSFLSL